MKAQRRLGLAMSWPRITSAFLLRELVVRVGPSVVGAAPQHSMRPAKESDELWSA
jgi:hypothetical protein